MPIIFLSLLFICTACDSLLLYNNKKIYESTAIKISVQNFTPQEEEENASIIVNMNHTRGCVDKTTKYAENWGEKLRLFEEKIKTQVDKNECFTLTGHDK